MAQGALGRANLHFDELNKIRILDPEVAQQTLELKEECKVFVDKIAEFQKIVGSLIGLVDELAKATENEKMKGFKGLLLACGIQTNKLQVIPGACFSPVNPTPDLLDLQAIGARNLLKSIAKQREAQQQQLQALITEKKMQLERYRVEYETLCKIEADQNEFIDQFIFQK